MVRGRGLGRRWDCLACTHPHRRWYRVGTCALGTKPGMKHEKHRQLGIKGRLSEPATMPVAASPAARARGTGCMCAKSLGLV